jgi:hypothetical protein
MALGIALSPLPIASVIILLMTPKAKTNAPAFLLGWIAGILAVGFVVFIIPGIETTRGDPTPLSGLIRIMLGIFLLALSWKQWQRRPRANEPVTVPKMLTRLDRIGTARSLATGFLFTAINPKNLVLTAAGSATIDSSSLAPNSQIIAFCVFTTIASMSVALPLATYFLARHSVEGTFARWKDWLIENNVAVLILLLLVFGTLLIGRGIKIIATGLP